jgi:hypothetical protein
MDVQHTCFKLNPRSDALRCVVPNDDYKGRERRGKQPGERAKRDGAAKARDESMPNAYAPIFGASKDVLPPLPTKARRFERKYGTAKASPPISERERKQTARRGKNGE